jgi:hypothetical protein
MILPAATFFCVNYPNRPSNVECKQLVWVRATSRGRLFGSRVVSQELFRTLSHWSSKGQGVPIPRGVMRRAGLAGSPVFDNAV